MKKMYKTATKMMTRKKAALFLCASILHLCNAVHLRCTVKRNGTFMVHTIEVGSYASDFQSVKCDYTWSNETTMLAHDMDKHVAVTNNSLHTLETSECHAHIFWKLQCWSKATGLKDYTANCSTTCADKNLLQGEKLNPKGGESNTWIKAVIGIPVLLGLVGLIFLLYKSKESISRMLILYSPVPKENNPEHPNVL